MKQTPATAALGCGGSLILFGSFISGFYLGNSEGRGQPVDSNLAEILKYGPSIVGGIYGSIAGSVHLSIPENLEEAIQTSPPNMSREQAEGCAKGCLPIGTGIFGLGFIGATTYLGYVVGHAMAK